MNLSTLNKLFPQRPKTRPSQLTRTTEGQTASGRKLSTSVTNSTAPGAGLIEKATSISNEDGKGSITKRTLGSDATDSNKTVFDNFQFTNPGTSDHTREYVAVDSETGSCYGWSRTQDESGVSNEAYQKEECSERFEALQSAWQDAYK